MGEVTIEQRRTPSRRSFFGGLGVAAVGLTAPALIAEPAEASVRPGRYPGVPVPNGKARHMGNRFSYGITPELAKDLQSNDGMKWFKKQLRPGSIKDKKADSTMAWWPTLSWSASQIWETEKAGNGVAWVTMANYARWSLARRITSKRQVLELMTEFWENYLYVPIWDDGVWSYRVNYGLMIRQKALTSFEDLLVSAITHPAMSVSLDNAVSNKWAVNENLGRELLDVHTVGQGNYTEDDVKNSALILTGYRVKTWTTWDPSYDPASHYTGNVRVLGFSHGNTDPNGQAVAQAYLRYLALHPKTAERVCRKLAQRFVKDNPSQALVAHLASVYLKNGSQIKPVLMALVESKEFKKSAGEKVRTPTDDVVGTYRALKVRLAPPRSDESGANAILWQAQGLGQSPFAWSRPDGPPESAEAWTSVSRMMGSFEHHWGMAGGWWPKAQVKRPGYKAWIPKEKGGIRFDQLVDYLSREILARPSTPSLLKACAHATGAKPGERITRQHEIAKWKMPHLLTTILDTPAHMSR